MSDGIGKFLATEFGYSLLCNVLGLAEVFSVGRRTDYSILMYCGLRALN